MHYILKKYFSIAFANSLTALGKNDKKNLRTGIPCLQEFNRCAGINYSDLLRF